MNQKKQRHQKLIRIDDTMETLANKMLKQINEKEETDVNFSDYINILIQKDIKDYTQKNPEFSFIPETLIPTISFTKSRKQIILFTNKLETIKKDVFNTYRMTEKENVLNALLDSMIKTIDITMIECTDKTDIIQREVREILENIKTCITQRNHEQLKLLCDQRKKELGYKEYLTRKEKETILAMLKSFKQENKK